MIVIIALRPNNERLTYTVCIYVAAVACSIVTGSMFSLFLFWKDYILLYNGMRIFVFEVSKKCLWEKKAVPHRSLLRTYTLLCSGRLMIT